MRELTTGRNPDAGLAFSTIPAISYDYSTSYSKNITISIYDVQGLSLSTTFSLVVQWESLEPSQHQQFGRAMRIPFYHQQ
jgi:hypothetical protein